MDKPTHCVVIHRVDKSLENPSVRVYRRLIYGNIFCPAVVFADALSILEHYKKKYPCDYIYIDRVYSKFR